MRTKLLILALLTGCGSDGKDDGGLADTLTLSEDEAELATRVTTVDQPVEVVPEGAGLTDSNTTIALPSDVSSILSVIKLSLVARVAPPKVGDQTLQATMVSIDGGRAYVSYNVAGEPQAGALDVIDVSGTTPKLVSQLTASDADFNALALEGGSVFAVGARNGKGFLMRTSLKSGLLTKEVLEAELPSFAGTGVTVSSSNVYATSGSGGGLTTMKKSDLSRAAFADLKDARGVVRASNGNDVVVVAGTPGRIALADKDGKITSTKDVGGASIAESKSTIVSGKRTTLVALGDGGVKLYCGAGDTLLGAIPAVVSEKIAAAALTVTNAASASKGLVFTANGEAGVRVHAVLAKKGACAPTTFSLLGSLSFGEKLSANGVVYDGTYLYVATGLGGLDIVRVSGVLLTDGMSDEFE